MENLNEEVQSIRQRRRNHPVSPDTGNWMMRQILRLLPKYTNSNKEPKAKV
jgi:hypothetical protein